jgi:hypothetical protein
MIAQSLAHFIGQNAELQGVGLGLTAAFVRTPDTALGELVTPFCLVSSLTEPAQELWEIGDAHRKQNPIFQVSFHAASAEQRRLFKYRFRRIMESAKANDSLVGSHLVPGIDYLAFADMLRDSGDHKTYNSDQPGWFSTPTPTVYKNEDANGEPIVVPSGYTIDATNGKITFASANAAADRIRATYKFGVIDFNIVGVAGFETEQLTDIANVPQRYVACFTLEAYYYIKLNANRYL